MSPGKLQVVSKFNPIWKAIAGYLSGRCDRCGHPCLYSVFDAYTADEGPNCWGCSMAFRTAKPQSGQGTHLRSY